MYTIGLVGKNLIFRTSLRLYFESVLNYKVQEATEGVEFCRNIQQTSATPPQFIVILSTLEFSDDLSTLTTVKATVPAVRIIILTEFMQAMMVNQMFRNGADVVIFRQSQMNILVQLFANVYWENKILVNSIGRTVHLTTKALSCSPALPKITDKQLDFLKLCSVPEYTYKAIADKLNLSLKTVDRYRDSLFKKLNVKSRTGLVLYALQNGLVNLSDLGELSQ